MSAAALSLLLFCCAAGEGLSGPRSWARREACQKCLARLGRPCWPVYAALSGHPSPEAAQRGSRLLAPFRGDWADDLSRRILPDGYPVLPWSSGVDGAGVYLGLVKGGGWNGCVQHACPSTWYTKEREATRLWLRDRLLWMDRAAIMAALGRGVMAEKAYLLERGVTPPGRK